MKNFSSRGIVKRSVTEADPNATRSSQRSQSEQADKIGIEETFGITAKEMNTHEVQVAVTIVRS